MYVAHYEAESGAFVSTVVAWKPSAGALLPPACQRLIAGSRGLDFAVRMARLGGEPSCSIFVCGPREDEAGVRRCAEALSAAVASSGGGVATCAERFDAMAAVPLPEQLAVDPRGYRHEGKPVACRFPLWPMVSGRLRDGDILYQVHLRPYEGGRESERHGRKYIAWLQAHEPFSASVRRMQEQLAARSLHPAMLMSEFVALPNAAASAALRSDLTEHFAATDGRLGFPAPPLEQGDFSDWLTTGRHPSRDMGIPSHPPVVGACLSSSEEVGLMLGGEWFDMTRGGVPTGTPPEVFISYSSADFAHAAAACAHLEREGLTCWMAPRNISTGAMTYPEAIALGIDQARAIVVLVSESADHSQHIPREVELALSRRLPIIPVDLERVTLRGGLMYLLSTAHRTCGFGRDLNDVLGELVQRVRVATRRALG